MLTPVLYALLSLVPVVLVLGTVEIWSRIQRAGHLRLPVTDKLLRSPGEGAYRKMKDLNRKALEILTAVIAVPATVLVFYTALKLGSLGPSIDFHGQLLVLAIILSLVVAALLIQLLKARDKYWLGFRGERFVGEELNKLMQDGCHVFHDFPLRENWNLDHVIVAPSGVYAIETKTHSKRNFHKGKKNYVVSYDGKRLTFPNYSSTKQLLQTQNQADRLAQFLNGSLHETIYVNPILTFPGWYVNSTGSGEVTVLNPKQIRFKVLDSSAPVLSPDKIKRVTLFLAQKSRNVAF